MSKSNYAHYVNDVIYRIDNSVASDNIGRVIRIFDHTTDIAGESVSGYTNIDNEPRINVWLWRETVDNTVYKNVVKYTLSLADYIEDGDMYCENDGRFVCKKRKNPASDTDFSCYSYYEYYKNIEEQKVIANLQKGSLGDAPFYLSGNYGEFEIPFIDENGDEKTSVKTGLIGQVDFKNDILLANKYGLDSTGLWYYGLTLENDFTYNGIGEIVTTTPSGFNISQGIIALAKAAALEYCNLDGGEASYKIIIEKR